MSAGELSGAVKRKRKAKKVPRHPWDWYVEQAWVTEQLIDVLGGHEFGDLIYDPCCGLGMIPDTFQIRLREYVVICSDRVERGEIFDSHDFALCDFLTDEHYLIHSEFNSSIVFNPPYSMQDGRFVKGLAEKFVRRALALATEKVCALLPVKWLASEGRHALFREHPPYAVLILSERPSMPPGDKILEMGDLAWKRGKVDYMWVVWDQRLDTNFGDTRTIWIAPRPKAERI